jgi:hypothetical protein
MTIFASSLQTTLPVDDRWWTHRNQGCSACLTVDERMWPRYLERDRPTTSGPWIFPKTNAIRSAGDGGPFCARDINALHTGPRLGVDVALTRVTVSRDGRQIQYQHASGVYNTRSAMLMTICATIGLAKGHIRAELLRSRVLITSVSSSIKRLHRPYHWLMGFWHPREVRAGRRAPSPKEDVLTCSPALRPPRPPLTRFHFAWRRSHFSTLI